MRIQLTCMSIGEAAGIAAVWGLQNNIAVNNVKWDEIPTSLRSYVSE
ncbi:FAD-dependent oxidoreductase [Anaerovibrio lipolyticus]|nr:FAD-dependent oxidoreductase [Anaerovibrio lipolyticus]